MHGRSERKRFFWSVGRSFFLLQYVRSLFCGLWWFVCCWSTLLCLSALLSVLKNRRARLFFFHLSLLGPKREREIIDKQREIREEKRRAQKVRVTLAALCFFLFVSTLVFC